MDLSSYERYGLHGNPFQLKEKNSLQALEIFHVTQVVDDELALLKEGVFNRENKAVVMLVGPSGIGKTHRLLLANREAELNSMFCVYYDIGNGSRVAAEGLVQVFLSKTHKRFSQPAWMKPLQKLVKSMGRGYNPGMVGGLIAEALNAQTPAFLLINGFHKLSQVSDGDRFLALLSAVFDRLRLGVCVMMECDAQFFSGLIRSNQGFVARITRQVKLPVFSDDEARLLLAKRLLVMRMVEDVDPLYPFTPESVTLLNTRARGVPQVLLQQASMVFDDATKRRVITIDGEYVTELFRLNGDNEVVDEVLAEEKPDLEVVDESERPPLGTPESFAPVKPVEQVKPSRNVTQKRGKKPRPSNPSSPSIVSPQVHREVKSPKPMKLGNKGSDFDGEGPLDDSEFSSNIKESNNEPFEPPEESEEPVDHVSTKFSDDSWKPLHQSEDSPDVGKTEQKNMDRRLIPSVLPKIQRNEKHKNVAASSSNEPSQRAKIKCPECSKIFTMTIFSSTKEIQCPYCQFRGTIRQ